VNGGPARTLTRPFAPLPFLPTDASDISITAVSAPTKAGAEELGDLPGGEIGAVASTAGFGER
jgi:hypothetical protein